jgi:membrane-associated phospholipid phosphatase
MQLTSGCLVAPAIYLGLESLVLPTQHAFRDFAGDLLVITESIALTSAFGTIMKFAFRRPRPARYEAVDAPFATFDQELSFPSGHVSLVAAASTAMTMTVFYRHPKSPMKWVVLGSAVALTVATAAGRVEGGHHFPTDVLMASMIGAFSGFAVPYLHRKEIPVMPTASIQPSTGSAVLGVTGKF